MKTLQLVEPRTPISTVPFTITQSGSYYLTGNLQATGSGITITASDVTLELEGFTLTGALDEASSGIFLVGNDSVPIRNVVVRNGTIREFHLGVRVNYGQNCRIEDLNITGNGDRGIYFWSFSGLSTGNVVSRCMVSRNEGAGIGTFVGSATGDWSRNTIEDCIIEDNASTGINLSIGSGTASGNTIADSVIGRNGSNGVFVSVSGGARVSGTAIIRSQIAYTAGTGTGITMQATGAGSICDDSAITDCRVTGNNGNGIVIQASGGGTSTANSIMNCFVSGNATYGINIANVGRTRVEGNHVAGQVGASTQGIRSNGALGNFILRNIVTGHTQNYFVNGADTYGPIVSSSGELATTGAAAHPWANFSR
jgi:hypothetical protein